MNVLQQYVKSLYSPKHIAAFRFQGIGKTILFIFVLMLITLIPLAIVFTVQTLNIFQHVEVALEESDAEFLIEDGMLKADFSEPRIREIDETFFIIDPKSTFTPSDVAKQYEQALMFSERSAYFIVDKQVEEISYRNFIGMTFTNEQLLTFLQTIRDLLPLFLPLALTFIYLLMTGLKFVGVSVLALFGMLLTKITATTQTLTYRHLWIIAAYSAALPTTIVHLAEAFRINIPAAFLLYWFIAIAIVYTALQAMPKRKTNEPK